MAIMGGEERRRYDGAFVAEGNKSDSVQGDRDRLHDRIRRCQRSCFGRYSRNGHHGPNGPALPSSPSRTEANSGLFIFIDPKPIFQVMSILIIETGFRESVCSFVCSGGFSSFSCMVWNWIHNERNQRQRWSYLWVKFSFFPKLYFRSCLCFLV